MNSSKPYNYDYYSESEWRILYSKELEELPKPKIIDPRNCTKQKVNKYFNQLLNKEQEKLKYLLPLDGWLAMIIYPSVKVKNIAQKDPSIRKLIEIIKSDKDDEGNTAEGGNWPIELELDSCRNF